MILRFARIIIDVRSRRRDIHCPYLGSIVSVGKCPVVHFGRIQGQISGNIGAEKKNFR